ncbi:MAG: efflux RND transporter periplasmic adaptor subunit [bacterium]|nr:efflux RND transporter periplasmic adaptor subunit [bacterium]
MRKFVVFIMSLVLVLFFTCCGKSGDGNGERGTEGHGKTEGSHQADVKQGEKAGKGERGGRRGKRGNGGQRPGGKDGKEIDLNSPEIPQRLKDAIKSGRISPERAKQMLARFRGGGGGDAPSVKVERVARQRINSFLVLNGVVEPERKVQVFSRLPAYVKKILKEEGDFVKRKDVLALLDDTEIRITHKQAELQLQQAKLTLKDEKINYKRSQKLKETDMISEQNFQVAKAAYDRAKLDFQTRTEAFKDLELQLSYTKIKAPSEGYVTERIIEMGSRVNTNQHVYTVEDFSPLLVKVYVPTSDIVNLKTGMETEVFTDVLSGRTFRGNIKLINPRIDVQSGTVKVTVEVFDKSRNLKPGMFVETRILISNNPNALVVPKKSVSYKQDHAFVYVFNRKGREVSKRTIKTGVSEGDNVEVLDGLEEDERVVTVGVESLKDKMKVNVIR